MRRLKRITALLLALAMSMSLLCSSSWASDMDEIEIADDNTVTEFSEPVNNEEPNEAEITETESKINTEVISTSSIEVFEKLEDAVEYVKESMINRQDSILLMGNGTEFTENGAYITYDSIIAQAVQHNGTSNEGDSLQYQYSLDIKNSSVAEVGDKGAFYSITLSYPTTAEQEKELDSAVSSLVSDLKLETTVSRDFDKIVTIHDYLQNKYKKETHEVGKDTAYDAIVGNNASSIGYALAFYRLALEVGVDARVVTDSENKTAWNIVEIGDLYYYDDVTTDDLLKGTSDFENHSMADQFSDTAFADKYTLAENNHSTHDYNYNVEDFEPTCTDSGYTTHTCICGASYIDGETNALGHDWQTVEATPATCVKTGLTEGVQCSRCKMWQVEQQETAIDPNNHEDPELVNVQGATCQHAGYTGDWYCNACKTTYQTGKTIDQTSHNYVIDKAVPATCISTGLTQGIHCSMCETVLQAQEVTEKDPTNHVGNTTLENYVAATCTEPGYSGDVYCSSCKEKIEDGHIIDALGHTPQVIEGKEPTCTEAGWKEYTVCAVCGDTITEKVEVEALGHNYVGEVTTPSTCTQTGVMTYTCTRCGDSYTDTISVDLKNHVGETYTVGYQAPTCTEAGETGVEYCEACGKPVDADAKSQSIAPLGHNYVQDEAVAPTCTKTGLTKGIHCDRCGEVVFAQETVEALGHKYKEEVTKVPTCSTEGTKTYTCTVCEGKEENGQYTEAIEKDPTNHLGRTEVRNLKDATCTEVGYTGDKYCLGCGEMISEGTEIPMKDHSIGYDKPVAATCTEPGKTAKVYCKSCGEVFLEAQEVPAAGHKETSEVTKEATCCDEGEVTYTCTVCGVTRTEVVEKNAENHAGGTEIIDAKTATCAEEGYTGDTYCLGCGEKIAEGEVVAKTNHFAHGYGFTSPVAATCTEAGKNIGILCVDCGTVIVEGAAIPATGHTWDSGKVTKEPTTTETGTKIYSCVVCGATKTEEIAKLVQAAATTTTSTTTTATTPVSTTQTLLANTITVSPTSKTYKYTAVKKKKKTFTIKVSYAQGKVTYTSDSSNITVTSKGKVTIAKKTPKGTYHITVTAAGNSTYATGSKTVTVKVK